LSASDEADVLTVAVAVVLPNRQLMVLANDLADTVSAVVLANTESEAALSVTDVADTLAANANMLSVRAITLAYTEPSDTTAALMGTIRSAFESITLQSTINRTVTLPSYMYGT
jgi:hypothetical protein